MLILFRHLVNIFGYTVLIAFLITRLKAFKQLVLKEKLSSRDVVILSLTFGVFGIFGTYFGIDVKGAILNNRNIGVIVGGILSGPVVGLVAGLIAGVHRFLIDVGGPTSIPCAIATVLGGVLSGLLYERVKKDNRWFWGLCVGLVVEHISFGLILLFTKPFSLAFEIVRLVYLPMIMVNGLGISIIIKLTESLFDEKEQIAAKQSKLALEIAEKTLPFFRSSSSNAFESAARVIKESIGASAVAFTDLNYIIAHYGAASDHHKKGKQFICQATQKSIDEDCILILNSKEEIGCTDSECTLKSGVVAPLRVDEKVRGTLKIYFENEDVISYKDQVLIEGLSKLISTQLDLVRLVKLEEMADKAEIRALQAQIHPHFLFNALNTVVSYVRTEPPKARELICDLSTFLRHNMENESYLTTLDQELDHVKAYVKIEQARFGDKLRISYEIDEDIRAKIPNLIIQPLVENALKHGYDTDKGCINVDVRVKNTDTCIVVEIEDDGVGISNKCIEKVYSGAECIEGIGLVNVHTRLRLLYGQGLEIDNQNLGTTVRFQIPKEVASCVASS